MVAPYGQYSLPGSNQSRPSSSAACIVSLSRLVKSPGGMGTFAFSYQRPDGIFPPSQPAVTDVEQPNYSQSAVNLLAQSTIWPCCFCIKSI